MIPADLRAQIAALTDADRASVLESVIAPLKAAVASFVAGEIGERELIAVELAVNETLADFPHANLARFSEGANRELRARLLELNDGAS